MTKEIQHKHILVRGHIYHPPTEADMKDVELWLKLFVHKIGMNIIQGPYVSYVSSEGNKGLTGVVMIETSHIAFHIWDEKNPGLIQFDLYTCSSLDVSLVLDELETFFDFEEYQYMVFDREHNFQLIEGSFSSYGDYDYGF